MWVLLYCEIYLELAIFVKLFSCPNNEKQLTFKTVLESARKAVERAFGALKGS